MIIHKKNAVSRKNIEVLMNLTKNKGWFTATYKGAPYSYQMLNTGDYAWFTDPYRYIPNTNGISIPESIKELALSYGIKAEAMLINKYVPNRGKLGLHQDKDETSRAPILSITIGCTGVFATANSYYGPQDIYELDHGDIFVFGKSHRMIYHGIKTTKDNHELGVRYNFTIRQVN